jgi:Protein of unknown function (DUF1097)
MPQLVALSLSIAVLGAIWAFLALGPLAGFVLVWAGFIAWGCFFHTGGDQKALVKTICGTVYGVIVAWIALLLIVNIGGGLIVNAIIVGVTVFFLVIVAKIDQLSAVPANVYGYAATVAYAISAHVAVPTLAAPVGATPEVAKVFEEAGKSLAAVAASDPLGNLTSPSFANPLVILIVSVVLGAILGYISGHVASALTKKAAAA